MPPWTVHWSRCRRALEPLMAPCPNAPSARLARRCRGPPQRSAVRHLIGELAHLLLASLTRQGDRLDRLTRIAIHQCASQDGSHREAGWSRRCTAPRTSPRTYRPRPSRPFADRPNVRRVFAAPKFVPSSVKRSRHHHTYRCRVTIGPTYRADMWAALEDDPTLSAAALARQTYGSFATAWHVRRDFAILAAAGAS
jgi:hypothetical protein